MPGMQDHVLTTLRQITESRGLHLLTQPEEINTGSLHTITKTGRAMTGRYTFHSDHLSLTLSGSAVDAAGLRDNPPAYRYEHGGLAWTDLRYDDQNRVRAMLALFVRLLLDHPDASTSTPHTAASGRYHTRSKDHPGPEITNPAAAARAWAQARRALDPRESDFRVSYRIVAGIDDSTLSEGTVDVTAPDETAAAAAAARWIEHHDPRHDARVDPSIVIHSVQTTA